MTRIDLTKGQCSALAEYLRGLLNSGMGAGCFGKIEMLVLAHRALLAAEEEPEDFDPPVPPPKPAKGEPAVHPARSGAAEAAELKRATLARLTAYRRSDGLVSFTPLAELCGEMDGKPITPELLGRMLNHERFPVAVWRAVSAGLDKMDKKDGGTKNED